MPVPVPAALRIAKQLHYIRPPSERDLDRMDKITATLVKLARPWLE